VLLALLPLAAFAGAQPFLPGPKLTPGVVADTDPTIICAPGYSRSHRVCHDKAGTLGKYGIPPAKARQFEKMTAFRYASVARTHRR
jgi:hypothetical protein